MKNDIEIKQDVIMELKWQPFLSGKNIEVAVKDGVITLSGQVDSFAQKMAAERAAKKVAGVRAIAEDIQIGVSPVYTNADTEIAASVLSALKWHSAVPDDKIKVKVESGVVTLEGEVEWKYQRTSARNAVSNLPGVRNIINNISVLPKAIAADIKSKIKEAFHRSATVDANRVSVDVTGHTAILRGRVRSYAEKEDAEDAAWCAPGVTTVENYLKMIREEEFTF